MIKQFLLLFVMLDQPAVREATMLLEGFTVDQQAQKNTYMVGELIGVELTLKNTSKYNTEIGGIGGPFSHLGFWDSLKFDVARTEFELWNPDSIDGRVNARPFPRGTELKQIFYLQDFLSPFKVGEYRIPIIYHTTVSYSEGPVNGKRSVELYARKVQVFKIVPATTEGWRKALTIEFERFRNAGREEEAYLSALSLARMNTVEAIPFLVRALQHPKFKLDGKLIWPARYPIPSKLFYLSKLPGAIAFLDEALDAEEPTMTKAEILTVLTMWGYALPADKLKAFQQSTDPLVQEKLPLYLEAVERRRKKTD